MLARSGGDGGARSVGRATAKKSRKTARIQDGPSSRVASTAPGFFFSFELYTKVV